MSITDQLDTQLCATNVVKLRMRRGPVGTQPRPPVVLPGGGNTPRPTSQPYQVGWAVQVGRVSDDEKRRAKNIWSLNLRRKLKSYVLVLA